MTHRSGRAGAFLLLILGAIATLSLRVGIHPARAQEAGDDSLRQTATSMAATMEALGAVATGAAVATRVAELQALATEIMEQQATSAPAPTARPTMRPTLRPTARPTARATVRSTPAPTATTIPPERAANNTAEALVDGLNIRSGPGTTYTIIASARLGQMLPVIGQANSCAWLQVRLPNGRIGWVSGGSRFTRLTSPCGPTPPGMVLIPAGSFQMGCSADRPGCHSSAQPLHTVTLDAYAIDMHEVTNGRYGACVAAGKCTRPHDTRSSSRSSYFYSAEYDEWPVLFVDYDQAQTFCMWEGKRLPTEAEWEKAARGSTDSRAYPWGNAAPDCTRTNYNPDFVLGGEMNLDKACIGDTARVGSHAGDVSPYGVMDMSGNAFEWVADWGNSYTASQATNPQGPPTGVTRILRGGGWYLSAELITVFARTFTLPTEFGAGFGFRCARSQ